MEAPICECGNKIFTLEERQQEIPKEYIPAEKYFRDHIWETYREAYRTYSVAVCSLCKKSYRI